MRNKRNKIGLDAATAIANEVIAMLDANAATKAGTGRRIAQIKAVNGTNHVDMDYSCDESKAQTGDAVSWLRNIGYTGGNEEDFSESSTLSSLNSNRPVLVKGYDTKVNHKILGITLWSTYERGHSWVMDGYLRNKRLVTVYVTTTSVEELPLTRATGKPLALITTTTTSTYYQYSPYYIHNNWGWNANHNGYFASGAFDAVDGKLFESNTKSNDLYNFQWENKIYSNIRR
jgi:hypothetical protein